MIGCGDAGTAAPGPEQTGGAGGAMGTGGVSGAGGGAASDAAVTGGGGSGAGGSKMGGAGGAGTGGRGGSGAGGAGPADAGSDAESARDAGAGSDAAGTTGGCSTLPVTPNATQQAKNVLCYLYSQYGNHILSGQEENATGQVSAAEVEVNYIFKNTGKYPAIRSFDVNNAGNATRCLSWWQANGLCVFGYHMGAPSTADGYQGSMTAVAGGIASVVTPGTTNNTVFNQRLDNVVNQALQVQQGNGVVILRLFHEAGGTWFWWSKEGGAQYVALWKYAFNYITNTRGLKGVLWLMPYDGSPQASFYPGKPYVDIAGADNYDAAFDYSPMTSIFNATRTIAGATIPIALHENGPMLDPDQLQSTQTKWLYFNTWTAPFPENDTTVAELQKIYSSSYVITRDEMPSLK
jgi:beta-mannanase